MRTKHQLCRKIAESFGRKSDSPKDNMFFLAADIFNTRMADIESAILSPFL
jgi:hypothetical protein